MSDPALALHDLLLWADCRLPDDVVATARIWLGHGLIRDAARVVAFAATTGAIPLRPEQRDVLRAALGDTEGPAALAGLAVGDAQTLPDVAVAPVDEVGVADGPFPLMLDLTDGRPRYGGLDDVDRAAIAAVSSLPGGYGLWRSWRHHRLSVRPGPATRGYVAMMSPAVPEQELPRIAGDLHERLAAEQADVLVRVFREIDRLPGHHRVAMSFGALLWTAAPTPVIRLVHATPSSTSSTSDSDRTDVGRYLDGGTVIWLGAPLPETAAPPVEPAATSFWTDGTWIWSDILRERLRAGVIDVRAGLRAACLCPRLPRPGGRPGRAAPRGIRAA